MNARDVIFGVIRDDYGMAHEAADAVLDALRRAAGGADRVVLDWSGTPCATCGGNGWKPGARPDEWGAPEKACPSCGGSGSGDDVVLHGLAQQGSTCSCAVAPDQLDEPCAVIPLWRLVPVTPEEKP